MTEQQENAIKVMLSAISVAFDRGAIKLNEAESVSASCRLISQLLKENGTVQGECKGNSGSNKKIENPGK